MGVRVSLRAREATRRAPLFSFWRAESRSALLPSAVTEAAKRQRRLNGDERIGVDLVHERLNAPLVATLDDAGDDLHVAHRAFARRRRRPEARGAQAFGDLRGGGARDDRELRVAQADLLLEPNAQHVPEAEADRVSEKVRRIVEMLEDDPNGERPNQHFKKPTRPASDLRPCTAKIVRNVPRETSPTRIAPTIIGPKYESNSNEVP